MSPTLLSFFPAGHSSYYVCELQTFGACLSFIGAGNSILVPDQVHLVLAYASCPTACLVFLPGPSLTPQTPDLSGLGTAKD